MNEEWRDVVGYEGSYQVSNCGRVRSLDRIDNAGKKRKGRMKRTPVNGRGYAMVSLSNQESKKTKRLHRLVAEAFLPNPRNHPQINHIDGNPLNNAVENLEWCDAKYNQQHAVRTGLHKPSKGSSHYKTDLNEFQVRVIKRIASQGNIPQRELGSIFGVPQQTISSIKSGRTWAHV